MASMTLEKVEVLIRLSAASHHPSAMNKDQTWEIIEAVSHLTYEEFEHLWIRSRTLKNLLN